LLQRAPASYARKLALTLLGLAACWSLVPLADGPLSLALAAVALGVAFCQVGLLAHDAAHHQVLETSRANRWLALGLFDLVVGLSVGWWLDKHNRHHAAPNRIGRDPDVASVLLAFTPAQALAAPHARRWIVRHQALLFIPLLFLEGFHLRFQSTRVVFRRAVPHPLAEAVALGLHFIGYAGLLLWWLDPWSALGFSAMHHSAMGVYLGLVFAPNHIGMPVQETDAPSHLHGQLAASRNVRPGPIVDFVFGGLNYQIEHHLFPGMPRVHLARARPIVRRFCAENGLPYREAGVWAAYAEVLAGLHRAGQPLRSSEPPRGATGPARQSGLANTS
jgi:fatty acid desaturase